MEQGRERLQTGDPLVQLGASLQEARQARGLDRATLAGQLHMGVEQLEALETADRSRLPEPVFVVAQARRVASCLGLDVAPLVEPLRALEAPQQAAPLPRQAGGDGWLRPAAGGRRWTQHPPGRGRAGQTRGAGARPQALALLAGTALVAALAAAGWWSLRRAGNNPATPQAQSPSATEPTSQPPAASGFQGGAKGAGSSQQLVLRSAEPSWLAVRRADGTILFEGTVQGERSFPLGQGLEVRAGRPDLVTARVGAGPARPLGPIEQIRWWSFRPAGTAAPAPQP